jgi:hypothetical protein
MAKVDQKGRWIDSTGVGVPAKYIKPLEKKRDAMVEKLHKKALALQAKMTAFRAEFDAEVEHYLNQVATEVGATENPGGNYQFTGFSGDKRVSVKRSSFIDFDEKLKFAKEIIDRCLERWSAGGNANLQAVVFDAFKVDKRGLIDRQRIIGLRRLNIKDAEWQEAMDLIGESIVVTGVKDYIKVEERCPENGEWRSIRLDIAAV